MPLSGPPGYVPTRAQDLTPKSYVDSKIGSGSGSTSTAAQGSPVVISQTNPGFVGPGVWYQVDSNGNVVQSYIETSGSDANNADTASQSRLSSLRGLRSWRAALAGAPYSPADVVVMDDSVGEGQGATVRGRRWVDMAMARLRAQYGLPGGDGYLPGVSNQGSYTYPWALAGGATGDVYGLGRRSVSLNGSGQRATITFTGTSFQLDYIQGSGLSGSFTVQVDGGSTTTVTVNGSGGFQIGRYTSAALTAASHTVVAQWVSGSPVYFLGGHFRNGDENSGIRLIDGSLYGSLLNVRAPQFRDDSQFILTHYRSLPNAPRLVICSLGLNDYSGGITAAQHQTDLQTLITAVKGAHTANGWVQPSFLLVHNYQRTDSGYTPASTWAQYGVAKANVAAADPFNVTFLDHTLRIDTTSQKYGAMNVDNIHPTDIGHSSMANTVAALVAAS